MYVVGIFMHTPVFPLLFWFLLLVVGDSDLLVLGYGVSVVACWTFATGSLQGCLVSQE